MTTTPVHLQADHCYVCGGTDHGNTYDNTGDGHNFWRNDDARRELSAEAARHSRPGYQEARYVATYRPY